VFNYRLKKALALDAVFQSLTVLAHTRTEEILLALNALLLIACAVILCRRLPTRAFGAVHRRLQTLDARQAQWEGNLRSELSQNRTESTAAARSVREELRFALKDTTDFAVMFLPVEGLYAEVLRRPGLCDVLQREFRVMVAGPTTLAALLNSLQMGFRTLAIEKRSSEVWRLLGTVKTEFGRFGEVLARTKKKLQEAGNTIDQAQVRSRVISRKLRNVQEDPQTDRAALEFDGEVGG
jgi:DNA anti-recombination protein RmuC